MKIAVGADHAGFRVKKSLIALLRKKGLSVVDCGAKTANPADDYPLFGIRVARSVASDRSHKGVLICTTGIGMSMVANKVKGVRAALVYNLAGARLSRRHNDANVLVVPAKFISLGRIKKIVEVWLKTEFAGSGRHGRRVEQIKKLEKNQR